MTVQTTARPRAHTVVEHPLATGADRLAALVGARVVAGYLHEHAR